MCIRDRKTFSISLSTSTCAHKEIVKNSVKQVKRCFIRISLWFNPNYKIMPRPKGSQNKLTTEVKEQLQNLIDKVVNHVDVDSMTTV